MYTEELLKPYLKDLEALQMDESFEKLIEYIEENKNTKNVKHHRSLSLPNDILDSL